MSPMKSEKTREVSRKYKIKKIDKKKTFPRIIHSFSVIKGPFKNRHFWMAETFLFNPPSRTLQTLMMFGGCKLGRTNNYNLPPEKRKKGRKKDVLWHTQKREINHGFWDCRERGRSRITLQRFLRKEQESSMTYLLLIHIHRTVWLFTCDAAGQSSGFFLFIVKLHETAGMARLVDKFIYMF